LGYIMGLRKIVGTRPLIMSGACVLLVHDSTLLLERRTDNGMWGLPGGSLEPGESMEQVASYFQAMSFIINIQTGMKSIT
jgi:8-oxo-dGTP pyrophosphatase MutT (NUDIX family)